MLDPEPVGVLVSDAVSEVETEVESEVVAVMDAEEDAVDDPEAVKVNDVAVVCEGVWVAVAEAVCEVV